MKEELQGKLVEILTSIQTAAGKASDFAMEQLPDIAQSYVAYGRIHESAVLLMALVCLGLGAVVAIRLGFANSAAVVKDRGSIFDGDWLPTRVFAAALGTFAALMSLLVVCVNLGSFFLVWFAPKVWLLKEIAGMLK